MASKKRTSKLALRWWQVLCRVAVIGVIAAAAAYALLPWWAPTGLLRDQLARQLSEQMGLPVTIDSVSLSWSRGVEIRGLSVAAPAGFEPGPMVRVRFARTELAPVSFLLHDRLAWMELEGPHVDVRLDANGNVNLAALKDASLALAIDRVSVHGALATLKLPADPRTIAVKVHDLQVVAGRLGQIGQITMSAGIQQPGGPEAPVSLSPGAGDHAVAAAASFTFSNVDLEQLPLTALLSVPMRRLAGRCGGSLDLRVDRQGVVDGFTLNVVIRRLDVQPADGPRLPVIDEAGFRVSATYDYLTRAVNLRSVRLRMPGVDLTGQGKVFTEILGGHWEALDSVSLRGKVFPMRLAALVTGRQVSADAVSLTGPVNVNLAANRQGPRLLIGAAAEATGAAIRLGRSVLKPADRPCRLELKGDFDYRTSRFVVDDTQVTLGTNLFHGRGSLQSIRQLVRRLSERRGPLGVRDVLAELGGLDWQGSWEVHELASLRDLLPGLGEPFSRLALEGVVTGRWFIHHGAQTRVHATLRVPAEARLDLAGAFVKPAAAAVNLDLSAAIDPNCEGLEDLMLDLKVGGAHLHADRIHLKARGRGPATASAPADDALLIGGRFNIDDVATFLAAIGPGRYLRGRLTGDLAGEFALDLSRRRQQARLSVDLKDARLIADRWFAKQPGPRADVEIEFTADQDAPPAAANRLSVTWKSPEARAALRCTMPALPPAGRPASADLAAEADIDDVGWLVASVPDLASAFGKARAAGPLRLSATGRWHDGVLDANASCDATDVRYASAARPARTKAAGVPLTAAFVGRLAQKDGRLLATIGKATVALAGSSATMVGQVELLPDRRAEEGKLWPQPALAGFRTDVKAAVTLTEPLRRLLPELDDLAARHGARGGVELSASVTGDANSFGLDSHVDARGLGVANFLPPAPPAGAVDANTLAMLARLGPLTKPPGMPAEADLALTCSRDLRRALLRSLRVQVGDLTLLADCNATLSLDANGLPRAVESAPMHLAVSTDRAETLPVLAPALAVYRPRGAVFLEAEIPDATGRLVSQATVQLDDVRARFRGRDCSLRGKLAVEKLLLPERPAKARPGGRPVLPSVGRIKTDDLEFRAGDNHGWLLADVADLPAKASGKVHLVAEFIDDRDLQEWLEGTAPAEATATQPAGEEAWPRYKLRPEEIDRLRREAGRVLDVARQYLTQADLSINASIKHLRSYDQSVERSYDVHRVELTASAKAGQVDIAYVGGLNGGRIEKRHKVDLNEAAPQVATTDVMHNVLPEENIQPQLAKFFPGNTVQGLFNRTEESTAPVADRLATALDARFPLRPVGTAKTVGIDGVTRGRAAPTFMTRIFPGLNLATYRYRKMTAFAEFGPDGSTYNDMVFDGKVYDLYMEGTTDTGNIGRYEIGLILLGTPQTAEWNHTYRQGRLPILNFKARIEGGKMHDEHVSYLWPNETLAVIFLKNNIVYRMWLAAGKNKGKES